MIQRPRESLGTLVVAWNVDVALKEESVNVFVGGRALIASLQMGSTLLCTTFLTSCPMLVSYHHL